MIKILGAALIVLAAGGAGFSMARSVRREERCLRELSAVLEQMLCEVSGRLTPVPELFEIAQDCAAGALKSVFQSCARGIAAQNRPNVASVMDDALDRYEEKLSPVCIGFLSELGRVLGAFDAGEQLQCLQALRGRVDDALNELRRGKADRCRSYEVLGVCAGCALAIILL